MKVVKAAVAQNYIFLLHFIDFLRPRRPSLLIAGRLFLDDIEPSPRPLFLLSAHEPQLSAIWSIQSGEGRLGVGPNLQNGAEFSSLKVRHGRRLPLGSVADAFVLIRSWVVHRRLLSSSHH
jgi:hypothetical protein